MTAGLTRNCSAIICSEGRRLSVSRARERICSRNARATSSARLTLGSGLTFSLRRVTGICMLSDNLGAAVNRRSTWLVTGRDVSMALPSSAGQRSAAASDAAVGPDVGCYPERPVVLVLPFPLGGSTGYTATVLARGLTAVFGQSFSVEPRTGNFGIAALQYLRDNPDGYTLLVGNLTSNSMTPIFHRDEMDFDYLEEIAPISKLADFPSVAMTQVSAPADA